MLFYIKATSRLNNWDNKLVYSASKHLINCEYIHAMQN